MVCSPETAVVYRMPPRGEREDRDHALAGVYCRSDCLLDARHRGWPYWLVKGQQS